MPKTLCIVLNLVFLTPLSLLLTAEETRDTTGITWKKSVLDKKFRAEGVAVADVNKDGKLDVLTRQGWYEAPSWKYHEIVEPRDYGDGSGGYSNCFACWTDDLNKDGWPDLIVIDFPGDPCYWLENPKGNEGHWKKHMIWHSACNETPQYLDLFGTGQRVLIMGWQPKGKDNEGQMSYFTPGSDPTALWEMHPISEPSQPNHVIPGTFKFAHGLGAGDINGDGRVDVICTGGWWEQPAERSNKPWTFHPATIGNSVADMYAYDVDGDGVQDVLCSSAHGYGIWWIQGKKDPRGDFSFQQRDLFPKLISQTHALHFVDINGDGYKDLVTGKRWWAHGPKGDADPSAPAVITWFEARKGKDGGTTFIPHPVDDDSGIGTQFTVADINGDGLPDIITSNKKGVYVFEQIRAKK